MPYVYIVYRDEGEYGAPETVGVFSTRENAQDYINSLEGSELGVMKLTGEKVIMSKDHLYMFYIEKVELDSGWFNE